MRLKAGPVINVVSRAIMTIIANISGVKALQMKPNIINDAIKEGKQVDTIQRLESDDFESGAASSNMDLSSFRKNKYWEIGFRKLSKVKPGTFNPSAENDKIIPLQKIKVQEGIPINHSIEGIAISRNADFVLDVLGSGTNKVVVIVAIPPDFGIDLEAEYLNWYREKKPDHDRQDKSFPLEYQENQSSRLSMEVTLQRVPTGCVYGWIERNKNDDGDFVLTYIPNPLRACPDINEIDDQGRYNELMSKVQSIEGVERVNFP